MKEEQYRRAIDLKEKVIPAFERLLKAVSVSTLNEDTIKELGDSLSEVLFLDDWFSGFMINTVSEALERRKNEFDNL